MKEYKMREEHKIMLGISIKNRKLKSVLTNLKGFKRNNTGYLSNKRK